MRYVCIHCHFYQPPRENPSLESIELQDSAYPYHDWNERITAECYAPNAASRILDNENRIVNIVNNYARISFNFGPTLLSWMEEKAPKVYQAILDADRISRETFSGHGSALAQCYNHMIMPLANSADKYTQVIWGIRDFEHRFGRAPEGMWLPETAVDLATLEIMAERGILFTILAPRQAARVRKIGGRTWHDVSGDRIDPTRAYLIRLPSRRKIHVFFYDGPISRAVAFEGLLNNGETFANRLMSGFADESVRPWPQLVHIATDGETYGHHFHHGEMALTYALHYIESNQLAQITNYGEYLERHPATHQVEIFENSSWSCVHGVERWKSNCGCNAGHPGWNQEWRAPLREALDWLRDDLASRYETKARETLKDPWKARNDYIDVILDRSEGSLEKFWEKSASHPLSDSEKILALKLLELQRHTMLMYTSCGWFFDELSGLETVQVIQYAGRAIQLAKEAFGEFDESPFLERLAHAKSNIPENGDGAQIFEKFVKPAIVDLPKVAAHYAVSSLFDSYPEKARIYCYTVDREDYRMLEAGNTKLVVGRVRLTSEITLDAATLSLCGLYFGDHNVTCGVRIARPLEEYQRAVQEAAEAFERADIPAIIRLLDRDFEGGTYSLKSLFKDEQRRILSIILESTLSEAEENFRRLYEQHASLMRFLADIGTPLPKAFRAVAEFALNSELRQAFLTKDLNPERIVRLFEEARSVKVEFDAPTLEYALRRRVEEVAESFAAQPDDLSSLEKLETTVGLACTAPFEVGLWKAQNICFELIQDVYPRMRSKIEQGDESAKAWVERFHAVAEKLSLRVNSGG
jgi:alpha-amylase/alpha-mannosidase (GH57 family)